MAGLRERGLHCCRCGPARPVSPSSLRRSGIRSPRVPSGARSSGRQGWAEVPSVPQSRRNGCPDTSSTRESRRAGSWAVPARARSAGQAAPGSPPRPGCWQETRTLSLLVRPRVSGRRRGKTRRAARPREEELKRRGTPARLHSRRRGEQLLSRQETPPGPGESWAQTGVWFSYAATYAPVSSPAMGEKEVETLGRLAGALLREVALPQERPGGRPRPPKRTGEVSGGAFRSS